MLQRRSVELLTTPSRITMVGLTGLARAQREDVKWWLSAAVDDYESAQLLFKGGKYSKSIHVLHNSAEKALKAAILAERKRPPRGAAGHNLARLSEMVKFRGIPPRLARTLLDLGPLYLPTEYPDAALGVPGTMFKKEQAQRYLKEVGALVKWLRKNIFIE
jgi:HEPN domain-containing protein